VQHQVPAVGPVESSLSDHREIGEKHAELGLLVNPAKQVVIAQLSLIFPRVSEICWEK
jgi:hypothetical protein